jgi:hypothetical protein
MITGRNLPSIARETRSGSLSVDLDDIVVIPPDAEGVSLPAPAELTLEEGEFHCKIRLPEGFPIPPELGVFFHRRGNEPTTISPERCLRISGRTPDGTDVELENVRPLPVHTHTTMGASSTYKFRFNKIHLLARESDALTIAEMRLILENLNQPAAETTTPEDMDVEISRSSVL